MSAWTRLLAASSLAIGSAWDLITHPGTGGGLSNVTTVAVTVSASTATASMHDSAITATVSDSALAGVRHNTHAKATPAPGIAAIVNET
jgi:hypothetical protein